ncbi:hypothetical protein A9Q96_16995 [Rhodobacterales bacterium 52_120_T64]|nr:hypothetical protein A9Q96_16995 [Rhodobacterales bacterium 52_120_T64]
MLLYLETNAEILADESSEQIELLFSELLLASMNGIHFVVIARPLCNWADQNLHLNKRETAHLKRLKHDFAQRGSIPKSAPCFIQIRIGDNALEEYDDDKYRIGHIALLRSDLLSDARLLLEHIENDGDLIDVILSEICRSQPIKNIKLQRMHGGGADIVTCFRHALLERRVTVCIADSDKYAPCDTHSATVRNLTREADRQTFVGAVCESLGREAENYIPIEILSSHRRRICPEYTSFNILDGLLRRQQIAGRLDCLWLFFDIKRGAEVDKLLAIVNPPRKALVRRKVSGR